MWLTTPEQLFNHFAVESLSLLFAGPGLVWLVPVLLIRGRYGGCCQVWKLVYEYVVKYCNISLVWLYPVLLPTWSMCLFGLAALFSFPRV